MSFKIAFNPDTRKFFTDISFNAACSALADNLKTAREAVKAGVFEDVAGAMAALPMELPVHFHNDVTDHISNPELIDPYAMILACLVGGTLEDVTSGGYVSWFWFDGNGQGLLKCRSGKGIAKKLLEG